MIDFATLQGLTIPEGVVTKITNAVGTVLWSVVTSRLPNEYQEVEWIKAESGEHAYIDLGFCFDTAATIYITQIINSEDSAYVFGAAENSGALRCALASPYDGNSRFNGSSGSKPNVVKVPYNLGENEFKIVLKKGLLSIENITNNENSQLKTQGEYVMNNSLLLFAQNYNGTIRYGSERILSKFKYYDKNDELVCDLVPCYRKSDGSIGMYDIVRKIFLPSIGESAFEAGLDVLTGNTQNLFDISSVTSACNNTGKLLDEDYGYREGVNWVINTARYSEIVCMYPPFRLSPGRYRISFTRFYESPESTSTIAGLCAIYYKGGTRHEIGRPQFQRTELSDGYFFEITDEIASYDQYLCIQLDGNSEFYKKCEAIVKDITIVKM